MAREFRKNLLLLLSSLGFALFLGELILRPFFPAAQQDSLFPPGQQFQLTPDPDIFPGITGISKYQVNSLGFRGTDPAPAARHILVIGGSTAECLYLDQEETWPALLESRFNKQQPIWIGNFSKSGLHSGHHLQQLHWLQQVPALHDVKLIYCLTGFNDLIHFLGNDSLYLSASDNDLYRFAFSFKGDGQLPWYKQLSFWKALASLKKVKDTLHQQDSKGARYALWRQYRLQDSMKREELPDLSAALAQYARNIEAMIRYAAAQGIKIIFITQPVCWNAPAVPADEPWFWLGKKGDFADPSKGYYYNTAALANGMDQFNAVLRNTVLRQKGYLADLAAQLPKNRTVFYDDCHFTEAGAKAVAAFLGHYTDSLQLLR